MKATLHPDRTLTLELSWEEWRTLPDPDIQLTDLTLRQDEAVRQVLAGVWQAEGRADLFAGLCINPPAGDGPGEGADVDPHAGHTGPASESPLV